MLITNQYEAPLRRHIDVSDPLYTHVAVNQNPKAALTDKTWLVYRITNASGICSYPSGDNTPNFQASEVLNYTYLEA